MLQTYFPIIQRVSRTLLVFEHNFTGLEVLVVNFLFLPNTKNYKFKENANAMNVSQYLLVAFLLS